MEVYGEGSDGRTFNPANIPKGFRVLDVGCGNGQALIENCGDRYSFGLDIDLGVMRIGKALTKNVAFVCGRAEALPFRDSSFDFVIARVSLPYTDILKSLREIRRVLKAGGQLWTLFERLSLPFRTDLYKKPRFWALYPYLLLNTLFFHALTKSIPFIDGKYRGYQTIAALRRALKIAGFEDIQIAKRLHLVATARSSQSHVAAA
jgi:ubiquinone/menaquinone biosynthesis C-methylase UbiE